MKINEILNAVISEVAIPDSEVKVVRDDERGYRAFFNLDGSKVEVILFNDEDNNLYIYFEIDNSFTKSPNRKGDNSAFASTVFRTVIRLVTNYISKNIDNIDVIKFTGDRKKRKLYNRLARMIEKGGFVRNNSTSANTYELYKR